MLFGIFLAFVSVACYAGYQLSNKANILSYGLHKSTLYLYLIAQIVLGIGLLIGYIISPGLLISLLNSNDWLFMIGLGFEGAITIILFFWLLDKTRLGLSYTLASTYSIMTVLGAAFFLHEHISPITFVAIIAAIIASLWLGYINSTKFNKPDAENNNAKEEERNTIGITIMLPLIVAVGWTFFNFGSKILVDKYGGFNTAFFTEGAVLLWIIVWALFRYKRNWGKLAMERDNLISISTKTALFFGLGGIAFYMSLAYAPLAIVSGILGLSPAVVFLLSMYYLGEKFTLSEILSISIIVISIACISVFH